MLYAADIAGQSMAQGLGQVHGLSHVVSGRLGTPHGVANAILLSQVLDYHKDFLSEQLTEIAPLMGINAFGMPAKQAGNAVVDAVRSLRSDINVTSKLSDVGMKESDIPQFVEDAQKSQGIFIAAPRAGLRGRSQRHLQERALAARFAQIRRRRPGQRPAFCAARSLVWAPSRIYTGLCEESHERWVRHRSGRGPARHRRGRSTGRAVRAHGSPVAGRCAHERRMRPLVGVVPPAANAQERFRSLKVMRPRFRSPERILTFEWPRHARALAEAGLWEHIARRLVALGWPETASQCDEAFCQLVEAERLVEVAAIRGGEGFQTLWPAGATADG